MDDEAKPKNDPFLDSVKDSRESGVRPDFLSNGTAYGKNESKMNDSVAARNALSKGEESASEQSKKEDDGLKSVRSDEEEAGGFYSGKGRKAGKIKNGKSKFSFKKKGPLIAIFGVLLGGGGLMMGAQSLLPFAIEEMIIEKFNSIGISSTMASDAWLDVQLNQGVRMENLKTGDTENLFAFSSYQVQQFEQQGIKAVSNIEYNNTMVMALIYQKNGKYVPVVGSDFLGKVSQSAIASASGINESDLATQISAADALKDPTFKTPYTTASKAWRGGASGWFDGIMSSITETKLSIRRNRWSRFVTNAIKDADNSFEKLSQSSAMQNTSDDGVDATYSDYDDMVKDEQGNTEPKQKEIERVEVEDGETIELGSTKMPKDGTLSKISSVLESKAVKAAAAAGEIGCSVLEGLMSIYTVVSAYQSLQFLNLITGYLEAVDKVKAGDGASSPIHDYSNGLTRAGESMDYTTGDDDGDVYSNGSGMESAGMAWLFNSSNSINPNNPSVRNVNFESIMRETSGLFKNIELTADVYEKCGYIKAGVATIDLATTILSFVPLVGQGIQFAKLTIKGLTKLVLKVAVVTALYVAIPIAAKVIANRLIKNAATEWFGEDLGNALVSGASKYLGGNGTSGGQSPGSETKVAAYLSGRDTVIADEARYQRAIRSPFDITSKYTFLGSMAYQMIPIAYSGSSVMNALSKVSSMSNSAIVGLLPSASAVEEQEEITSKGECKLLESTGAIGDAFCNPYVITDTSTMYYSPLAIDSIVHSEAVNGDEVAANDLANLKNSIDPDNFDGDKIKPDSDLAKYITYCGQRTSQYGIKDASVTYALTQDNFTKIIGKIPVLNNIGSIVEGWKESRNASWINGSACVASEENEFWDTEYKYYQRYAENERLLENMNPGYTSTVTAYLQDYYEENPVDDSLEGTLARFSGLSKEQVTDTLALIEYYDFVENYDPSERYSFVDKKDEGIVLQFDNDNELAKNNFVLLNEISFFDVRNRVFTV